MTRHPIEVPIDLPLVLLDDVEEQLAEVVVVGRFEEVEPPHVSQVGRHLCEHNEPSHERRMTQHTSGE